MLQNDASQTGSTEARNDLDVLAQCDLGPATGNAITGAGTVSGAAGADSVANGPATIVAVNGVESSGGTIQVEGTYGTLEMNADGSYTYIRKPGAPDGVSDVFTYTLADAAGARDDATLTIDIRCEEDQPQEAQNLVTTPDGVVMLPAGVELSDIRVVGRDLVITLPDGSTMTIPGGAVFVPQLVIGDVEVPPTNLAALLIEQEPQPASGTPESSGGNFAVDVPPLDPGVPLGDLLPPTEFGFPEPVFEEVGDIIDRDPEILIQPEGQPASVAAVDSVEEAGLPERDGNLENEPAGSAESADGNGADNDVTSETTTGVILIDSPDEPNVVTINGVAVTSVGQTFEGEFGTLTITSISDTQIGYTYTLADNTSGDATHDDFSVSVTDNDGDVATATLTINIIDDVPTARNDADSVAEDGPLVADGNVFTGSGGSDANSTDGVADTPGADDAEVDSFAFGSTAGTFGVPLAGAHGSLVLQANGSYTYTLDNNDPDVQALGVGETLTEVFTYTIVDGDGDPSTATLTITITGANDAPIVGDAAVVVSEEGLPGANPDTVGVPADDTNSATASGSVTISDVDGDDMTVTLGLPAGTFFSNGVPIVFDVSEDGHTLTGTAGEDTIITVTIDDEGNFDVVLSGPVDHANPEAEDEFSIEVPVTASDGTATGDGTITIAIEDDSPVVSGAVAGEGVLLDETDAGSPEGFPISATSTGAVVTATASFGADGPGTQVFGLNLQGGVDSLASGLQTAIGDHPITLVQVDANTIEGRYEDGGTQVAFTIDIDPETGELTVTQEVPLEHLVDGPPGPAHDDPLDLGALVEASVTLTDADGDSASDSAAIGDAIVFEDDGPTIDVTASADAAILLETQDPDTIGGASDSDSSTADFGGVFDAAFDGGADGAAGTPDLTFTLGVSSQGVNSGLTQGGAPIFLYLIGGVVVGSTSATQAGVNAGNTVFDVSVNASGVVTLTQHSQVDHPIADDPSPTATPFADDTITLADTLVTLTASGTVTDNDGDFASDSVTINIGANLILGDDGPDISAALTGTQIRIDETDGVVAAGGEVDPVGGNLGTVTVAAATLFTVTNVHTSADSPTTLSYALTLSSQGVNSGLQVSSNNAPIFLYNIGGTIHGSTSATLAGVNAGNTAFTVSINPTTGAVTMTQFLAVEHSNTASNDEDSSGLAAGALSVTVTATDFDGDTDTASVDLGSVIRFEDDGPTASGNQVTGIVDEDGVVEGAADAGVGDGIAGGPDDVAGTATVATGSVTTLFNSGSDTPLTFSLSTNTGGLPALTSNGVPVTYSVVGNTLTASAGGETVFTLVLESDGDWTFTLVDQLDHPTLNGQPGDDTENELTIALGSIIVATDADGDPVTANANGLVITVDDDTPVARNDTDAILAGGNSTTGNVITGAGTTSGAAGADSTGADAPATITAISGADGTDTTFAGGFLEIGGDHGTLQIDANGNYTYTRDEGSPGNVQDVFTYTYTDRDGDSVTATLTITIADDAPVLTAPPTAQLDDDALTGGNPGTPAVEDDPDNVNTSGNLSVAGGDGDVDFFFSGTQPALPAGFTFNPVNATTMQILQGATVVLTITLNNETGAYTIVQNNPIDHPSLDGGAGDNLENNLTFNVAVFAEDADGDDSNTVNIVINVDDDTPVATATQLTGIVDEDGVLEGAADAGPGDGIAGGPDDVAGQAVSATGNVSSLFSVGADTPGTFQLLSNFAGLTAQNLTSGGVALSYSVMFAAGVYTLTATAGPGGDTVFTFTLNATTGAYNFTLVDQLDHANIDGDGDNVENELTINLSSIIQVTDFDGDSVVAGANGLIITVDDDTPIATTTQLTAQVDEDDVTEGAADGGAGDGIDGGPGDATLPNPENVATGNISTLFQSGADEPLTFSLSNVFTALTAQNLTSGGVALTYSVGFAAGVWTLTASAGGNTVFTFAVNATTGAYTFTLVDQLDHPTLNGGPGDNTENELTINLSSIIQATDRDGDTVTAGTNGLIVTVDDDSPIAFDPDPITSGLENSVGDSATAFLDVDDQIENNVGADEPGIIQFANITNGDDSGFTSDEDPIEYWLSNNGQTLQGRTNSTDGTDGTLIFEITLNQNPSGTDTYTITMFGTIDNNSGFDFDDLTSTAAGNVEFRGVGANDPTTPIDLLLSALSDDGTPGTVNTDSDSIGSDNQSMNAGETIRIDFVTNLTSPEATTSGFGFDAHVSSNQFLGMIPQVQGNQDQTVSFTVYALDTTLTETGNPDRDPDGGFSDSTITEITEVTVIDWDTGATHTEDISGLADGATEVLAFGISVTKNADGSVTFHGIQEGDQYGFGTDGDSFNAIVVEAHDEFDLGVFSIGTVDFGDPIQILLDLQLTDADGDTVIVTDALDITVEPDLTPAAAAALPTKGNSAVQDAIVVDKSTAVVSDDLDQQLKSMNAANNNAVFLGAVAAAGIMAAPAAAHGSFVEYADLATGNFTLRSFDTAADASADRAVAEVLTGKSTAAVQDSAVSASSRPADQPESQPVDSADAGSRSAPAELPGGTDTPADAAAADSGPTAMSVAMPSAEALAAAAQATVEPESKSVDVGRVVADALEGGAGGPGIDAVLDAFVGAHQGLAMGPDAAVSAWDMGAFGGFTAGHTAFTMESMMIHPDAAPQSAA